MAFVICELNGYIIGIGKNQAESGGITEAEYNQISELFKSKPTDPDGYAYRLRADTLEWELVELPEPSESDDEATEYDYIDALQDLGVEVDE